MRKIPFFVAAAFCCANAIAQVKVNMGTSHTFNFEKQPWFTSSPTPAGGAFLFKSKNVTNLYPTLITVDENGNIRSAREVKINAGTFNNMFEVHSVHSLNNGLVALIENRDKSAGLNKLSIRRIDETGSIDNKETAVGSFEYKKMMQPGHWFAAVTPDRKHLAIVGQLPHDKDAANQYKFFFLDANLTVVNSGTLSFTDDTRKTHFSEFFASDKGDLYLVSPASEKGYTYPLLYKASVSATKGTIVPVQFEDGSDKVMSYTTFVNDAGDLILSGYFKKKAVVTIDEAAKGTWWYSAAEGKMKKYEFEKNIINTAARGMVQNGNTIFLVGEQYKPESEPRTQQQGLNFEENFRYKHSDVLVTAFNTDGTKKFEVSIPRTLTDRNFDQSLYPAFGVLNGKLAVVFNDLYEKHFPNSGYTGYKTALLTYVTNDGLMEQPITLEKEVQTTKTYYQLYPQFFTNTKGNLVMLAGNGTEIKGAVFR
jgi:hypothetical protein